MADTTKIYENIFIKKNAAGDREYIKVPYAILADPPSIPNVVQDGGESTADVMSQKAVSDALTGISQGVVNALQSLAPQENGKLKNKVWFFPSGYPNNGVQYDGSNEMYVAFGDGFTYEKSNDTNLLSFSIDETLLQGDKHHKETELTNENLDSVVDSGWYNAVIGNTCINKPSDITSFGLEVGVGGSSVMGIFQILTSSVSGERYVRFRSSGTWSEWHKVAFISDLDKKANTADLATVATSGSYNDLSNKPTIPSAVTSIDGLGGGTLTSPIKLTGGDGAAASKMILTSDGQITDTGTSTLFGFSGGNLIVGHGNYPLTMRGKQARPTWNGKDLALKSDIPDVSGKQDKLTAGSNITISGNTISATVPTMTFDGTTLTINI